MKIKEIIPQKLVNFREFLLEQFLKSELPIEKTKKISDELESYMINLNLFIEMLFLLSGFDSETAVRLYLKSNDIEYDDIKDKIDSNKLIRYIEFFCGLVKN